MQDEPRGPARPAAFRSHTNPECPTSDKPQDFGAST
jgi:hypothetical protein